MNINYKNTLFISIYFFLTTLVSACGGTGDKLVATIALPDAYYPEGLTSKSDGTLFTGSLTESDIRIARPGMPVTEVFIAAGTDGLSSVLGLLADEKSNTLFACSNSLLGVSKFNVTAPSTLHAFDLTTGSPKGKYALPVPVGGATLCNDIAIDAIGRILVTDSLGPRILQLNLPAGTFSEAYRDAASGGLIVGAPNYNGITASPSGPIFVSNYAAGKLFSFASSAVTATEIVTSRPLLQPDGIRFLDNSNILVVEQAQTVGDGNQGAVSIVNVNTGQVSSAASGLTSPTSAVRVGARLYYVEGQYAKLFNTLPGVTLKPFAIKSVPIN
jgi:hypothetical protein